MTERQIIYRKTLLKAIHANSNYKKIYDNNAWSDYLFVRFGVESSKYLSIKELNILLDILNGVAADKILKADIKGREVLNKRALAKRDELATYKQIAAIRGLWGQVGKRSDSASLMRFIKRATKNYYLNLEALLKEDATKVILALKKMGGELK